MTQFYVQRADEYQCRNAVMTQEPIIVTGITFDGTVLVFSGVVQMVENSPVAFPDYPLSVTSVTMED